MQLGTIGLGRMGAGTPVRQLRGDDLVHHGGVRLDAEEIVGEFHVAGFGTGERGHRELHSSPPSDALTCTVAGSLLGGLPASLVLTSAARPAAVVNARRTATPAR